MTAYFSEILFVVIRFADGRSWAYNWVVVTLAWLSNLLTVKMSVPAASWRVANVSRNLWKVICFVIPAAFSHSCKGRWAMWRWKSLNTFPVLRSPNSASISVLRGWQVSFFVFWIRMNIEILPSASCRMSSHLRLRISLRRNPVSIENSDARLLQKSMVISPKVQLPFVNWRKCR